ncbi:MAG: hypothetical protein PWP60_1163 [Candidatus Atribacteria bacterium]|jgi:EmrB/QacA subfamily drug resistance transporter|nr:hypothetical protein [Candidatus Atribacteria bacterium]
MVSAMFTNTLTTTGADSYKRAVLLSITLGSFLTPFMGSSINVALPAIGKEFAMDAVLLGWIPTAYLLAAAVFMVPSGRLADIYGRKKIFTCGVLIYTIASFLAAVSNSPFLLIAFRVLQGTGGAMIFSTGVAILTSVFPPGERGRALGINTATVYLGLSLGPFLGGLLTQYLGWRSLFWLNVVLGLLVIVFTLWKLKDEWAEARGEKFDFLGSLIYACFLVALIYGFSLLPDTSGAWLVLAGSLGFLVFVVWEMKVARPVLDVNLFRNNTVFAFSNLAALINYSATAALTFLLSLYLQYIKGFNPQGAGLILVAQPAVMAIFSPFAGRISDRVEPRVVASMGMAFTALGLFLFAFLGNATDLTFIVASLLLLGFGFALFSSPNTNAIMSSVEKKFYGVASATLATMRLVGQMLSMGIAMLIFAVFMGRVQITPERYPLFLTSVKVAFMVFASLCVLGIFASLARGNLHGGA